MRQLLAGVQAVEQQGRWMRVELVCPAVEDSAYLPSLALATLAGLTPPGVEISLKDDVLRRLDPARDLCFSADLAAITVSTKTASRAYELAAAYRCRGVPVVLGGIHPTALPEEALEHADAVVVGEAEGLWPRLLVDHARGELGRLYRHEAPPDFSRPPRPRREIFAARRYVPVHTVQVSRGCPFSCEFCSVAPFFGRELRQREVWDVVEEIEGLDRRWVMFADDNILGRPRRARELFRALAPLGLTWFGQASLSGLGSEQDLRLMAASGCKALFVGFESVNRGSLASCGKPQNDPRRYRELIRRIQDHGIVVWASFVFGLDEDEPDVFERTVALALEAGVFMASFSMLTPYPGTPLYRRLQQEGRLIDERWWLRPERDELPLLQPRRMTVAQLHQGWRWAWKEFYRGGSILRRLRSAGTSLFSLASFLPLNLLQRQLTRRKILQGNRFFLQER